MVEALAQRRAPLTMQFSARNHSELHRRYKMPGTPLTKPLHNGSVQTGTGVSCMGSRRGSNGFTAVRSSPWPLGLAVGVGAFFAIRNGVPWLLPHQNGPIAQGFNQSISSVLPPIALMVLGMCCLASFASFVGSYQLRKLLDICTTLESLAAKGWRQFEMLVGEAFRRQRYAVEEASQDGACGGIHLIPLKDDGRRILMQCKQWKHRQADVSVAREMYDLLAHHNSDAVKIFCVGIYKKRRQQVCARQANFAGEWCAALGGDPGGEAPSVGAGGASNA